MKEYKIIKLTSDDFKVDIKDEEPILFRRDIKLITGMQKYKVDAKLLMMTDLKEKGLTKEDFVNRTTVDGKLVEDWKEYEELLQSYYEVAQQNVGSELYVKLFGMSIYELMERLDMQTDQEAQIFTEKVLRVIQGENKIPSPKE